MSLTFVFNYTERALSVIGSRSSEHFSYALGMPFPQLGDHIENQTTSGPRRFVVIDRTFTFHPESLNVLLLLDLPSRSC